MTKIRYDMRPYQRAALEALSSDERRFMVIDIEARQDHIATSIKRQQARMADCLHYMAHLGHLHESDPCLYGEIAHGYAQAFKRQIMTGRSVQVINGSDHDASQVSYYRSVMRLDWDVVAAIINGKPANPVLKRGYIAVKRALVEWGDA